MSRRRLRSNVLQPHCPMRPSSSRIAFYTCACPYRTACVCHPTFNSPKLAFRPIHLAMLCSCFADNSASSSAILGYPERQSKATASGVLLCALEVILPRVIHHHHVFDTVTL